MESYQLKYGEKYLNIQLPNGTVMKELHSSNIEPISDIDELINDLLDNPIDSKPFNEIFTKGDKVVIVSSDITRMVKLEQYLPIVVERLNQLGIPDNDITVLIATGTHRAQTMDEKAKIVGEEMFKRIKVIDHSCDDPDLQYVGTTIRGTEVNLNRLVVEQKVILTGGIVHHLMAGFGGGRKSIVPGVAGRETIAQNHLHSLAPDKKCSNTLIGVGKLTDNPLHLDMVESAHFVEPDFLINSIIDPKGNLVKLVAGNWLTAWEAGCKWADEKFGVPIDEEADLVVASCGGFPKDISLYQSTKTLFNASLAVKKGGTILLLAECREGAGADEFFGWSTPLKEGNLDEELRKNFTIPGYIFYAAVESAEKAKVVLVSEIDPELVKPMGIIGTNSLDEALKLIDIDNKNNKTIVMPYGGFTVPLLENGEGTKK